jgi:hypothetical protein
MAKSKPKLYVIREFIKAHSAAEPLRKDKVVPVDEIYLDEQ